MTALCVYGNRNDVNSYLRGMLMEEAQMKELIEYMAKSLVDRPENVSGRRKNQHH